VVRRGFRNTYPHWYISITSLMKFPFTRFVFSSGLLQSFDQIETVLTFDRGFVTVASENQDAGIA
jgi:hypothetical protein